MVGKEHEYKAMADCEKELWWYRSLHQLTVDKIRKYITSSNASILDAGCGTGGMLNYLKENGFTNSVGFDLSQDAIHYTLKNFQFDVRLVDIVECDKAYAGQTFDIIICNDVLCLLKGNEDKNTFKKLASLLKPGGFIFMNLPAGQAFKGGHDIACNIVTRYSTRSIGELTNGILKTRELLYWPFLLSPVIFSVRLYQRVKIFFIGSKNLLSDVKMPPKIFNRVFKKITILENKNLKIKPWGSSIFVVLQKLE